MTCPALRVLGEMGWAVRSTCRLSRVKGGLLRPASTTYLSMQHFLYLRPLPHEHGSLRPTFGLVRPPRKARS